MSRWRLRVAGTTAVLAFLLLLVCADPFGSDSSRQFVRIARSHDPTGLVHALGGEGIAVCALASPAAAAAAALVAASSRRPFVPALGVLALLEGASTVEMIVTPPSVGGVLYGLLSVLAGTAVGALVGTILRRVVPNRSAARSLRILWRTWLAVLLAVALLAAVAVPLFVRPVLDPVGGADALVVLGPATDRRVGRALALLEEHRDVTLVLSTPRLENGSFARAECDAGEEVRVVCFTPSPFTTGGEISELNTLSSEYDWTSVALMTSTPHVTRVRTIASRCLRTPFSVGSVDEPRRVSEWTLAVVYQVLAFGKLLVLQSCESGRS
ncbi:hypothetical protein C5C46_03860 [Rathayibacter sp. AY1E6]|nr:hypothetical protein C5C46_03860 [Rathayibacter sp. AY1E6]